MLKLMTHIYFPRLYLYAMVLAAIIIVRIGQHSPKVVVVTRCYHGPSTCACHLRLVQLHHHILISA